MAFCAIMGGCGQHGSHHEHEHEHEEGAHHHEDGHIEISPERQEQLGIRVETVSAGDFNEVIRTSGRISAATGGEMTVVARSEGIVNLGSLAEGMPVAKGGRIAAISTREIGSGDRLAKAKIVLETAQKEYERDLRLREDNIVSEGHLDQSRLAYEQARLEYEAKRPNN